MRDSISLETKLKLKFVTIRTYRVMRLVCKNKCPSRVKPRKKHSRNPFRTRLIYQFLFIRCEHKFGGGTAIDFGIARE